MEYMVASEVNKMVVTEKNGFEVGEEVLIIGTNAFGEDFSGKTGVIKEFDYDTCTLSSHILTTCIDVEGDEERLIPYGNFTKLHKFEIGERVKCLEDSVYNSTAKGLSGTVKQYDTDENGDEVLLVHLDKCDRYIYMKLENVEAVKKSKQATIETEKIWIGKEKGRKITGFKNIVQLDDVMNQYLSEYPFFYVWNDQDVVLKIGECGKINRVHLLVGDHILETDFQYYVKNMKIAGDRFAAINKKIKAEKAEARKKEWSGTESITI